MCTPNCISARQSPESINSWNPSIQLIHCRLHLSFPKKKSLLSVCTHGLGRLLALSHLLACLTAWSRQAQSPMGLGDRCFILVGCWHISWNVQDVPHPEKHLCFKVQAVTCIRWFLFRGEEWVQARLSTSSHPWQCSCFSEGQVPPSLVKFCL